MNENNEIYKVHPGLARLFQEKLGADTEMAGSSPALPQRTTIDVWNGYLLCSLQDYSSAKDSKQPANIITHDFEDLSEAASFVCTEQLRRKDLTNSYRKYLIGKKFSYEEALFHKKNLDTSTAKYRVAYKIGDEANISGGTVLKYNVFSTAIDTIFKNAEELGYHLLMERVKVSHENTIELSRLMPDEIRYLAQSVIKQRTKHLTFQDIRHECEWKHTNNRSGVSRRERRDIKSSSGISIRQMPVYNPDSDVNSLCMTIDSWVSSIQRVRQNVDFSTISRKATVNLVRQLTILEQTVNSLQKTLEERDVQ